jgi:CBS domain containing-hemolysin-like protein
VLVSLAILVISILMVAFFSSSEASLISASKIRIRSLAQQGNRAAQAAKDLWENHDKLFATILLTENAFIVFASSLGTTLALLLFGEAGLLMASLVMTVLIMLFGEITPKTFAARNAERVSLLVARPISLIVKVLTPVIYVFTLIANSLISLVSRGGESQSPFVTPEEIRMLATIGEEEGTVLEIERDMVHKVFEFGQRRAQEVMIARPDIVGIEAQTTIADLLKTFTTSSHSRFPVYSGDLDNITGFVSIKDILLALAQDPATRDRKLGEFARSTIFVPETKEVGELFYEMRSQRIQIAAIIDECGGTAGIVTLQELVEEIVGRLTDEWVTEHPLVEIDEHTMRIDGLMRIDEVNQELGIELPEDDNYETVAGLILYQLCRIPEEGEQFHYGDLDITVQEMKGPKIEKVLITKE